uniref:RING-type domain-containing protein n=1 Tax=Chrysotila carterae TaxID=13221 RepID=A0A7S4BTP0_CHRCT
MKTTRSTGGAECMEPIVFAVVPRSPAAQAGLHAFDMLLAVNHTRVRSTQHALTLLREASGPIIHLAIGRAQALHDAALITQRAWRKATGVFHFVYTRQRTASPLTLAFESGITCAAVIASVPPDDMCHGLLRAQQALLFVNDKMCCNGVHAQQLLAHAAGEVVLLCKEAKYVDVDLLRALSPDEPEARYSNGIRECPICMHQMAHPVRWVAGCGHQFCAECTERCCSQSDTCPLCRATPKTISVTPALLRVPGSTVP